MVRQHEIDGVQYFLDEQAALPEDERDYVSGPQLYAGWDALVSVERVAGVLRDLWSAVGRVARDLDFNLKPDQIMYTPKQTMKAFSWKPQREVIAHDLFIRGVTDHVLVHWDDDQGQDISLNVRQDWERKDLIRLDLNVKLGDLAVASLAEQGDALLPLLGEIGVLVDARWGFITYDRPGGRWRTSYEQWYAHDCRWEVEEYPRGYHWANLLSARHIDGLGGVDALRTAATSGGLTVSDVRADPALVVVAIPQPVDTFDDASLTAMKHLLSPILRHPRYCSYDSEPMRIIKDPGDAYIRIDHRAVSNMDLYYLGNDPDAELTPDSKPSP